MTPPQFRDQMSLTFIFVPTCFEVPHLKEKKKKKKKRKTCFQDVLERFLSMGSSILKEENAVLKKAISTRPRLVA